VGYLPHACERAAASLLGDHVVEGSSRDECVDEVALERVRGTHECVEACATVAFGLLQPRKAGLRDAHPFGEVFGCHAERFADGAYPAAVGACAFGGKLSPRLEAVLQGPSRAGMCSSPIGHQDTS
jgi:hypothetical protein